MISTILKRGVAAGAAGVTALDAVTYLDMAIRGRGASEAPERTVDAVGEALGADIPGRGAVRRNRRSALGALSGIGTGIAVGVAASTTRALGFSLPAPLGALATGAAAMAASDVPMAALGISDPRAWGLSAWVSDVVPHLAYGVVTHGVVHAQPTEAEQARPTHRASAALLARSAVLGVAAGGRSSLGLAGPALTGGSGAAGKTAAVLMVGGELVIDKLPATPSRTQPPALGVRVLSGAGGATALARREHADPTWASVLGGAGAVLGTRSGAAWRAWAAQRMPDWQAALIEDAVAVALTAVACLPHRGSPAPQTTYPELVNPH
ncbi:MAG: hypothetical protein ABI251_02070 [Mycobacteriaceae bacterium]